MTTTLAEKFSINEVETFVAKRVVRSMDAVQNIEGNADLITVTEENGDTASFKMVDVLGKGASAKLYKAYSRKADEDQLTPIAIKRINGAAFEGYEEDLENLLHRERRALKALQGHRHHVTEYFGYYYHEPRNEHWLAMEFCNGGSLFHLSHHLKTKLDWARAFPNLEKDRRAEILGKQAKLDPNLTKIEPEELETVNLKPIQAIAAGALRGIQVIHEAGFIHGDIKSGNILLCYPGLVKICDFGLASKFKDEKNPDLHALGTLDYMAPELVLRSMALDMEQPDADKFKYDYKVDVWALGAVILELLLGKTAMAEYRKSDENAEEFQNYMANMCKHENKVNMGSALGYIFYLPPFAKEILKGQDVRPDIDRHTLLSRFPVLANNKKCQLKLLMRPHMYRKKPDPTKPVPKLAKVSQLYKVNIALDFIAQCMFIKPNMRPDAQAMGAHQFVKSCMDEMEHIEPYLDEIAEMEKSREVRKEMWKKHKMALSVHEIFKVLEADRIEKHAL